MTRQIAWEECSRVGAVAEKSPTKPHVLVVGDINPAVLRPGSDVTGKAGKRSTCKTRASPSRS